MNYGAIGAVIGHEIGHGFDDQGRRSTATASCATGGQPADEAEFQKRAKLLVEQFNAFSPLPGLHVNGELTLGENIGDLGGLVDRLQGVEDLAQRASRRRSSTASPAISASSWAGRRSGARRRATSTCAAQVLADPHALGGVPRQRPGRATSTAFYDAFSVKPGDKLYREPEKRVKIW